MGDEQIKGISTSLRGKLTSLPHVGFSKPSIYKVPKHVMKVNEECYRPSIVSIGPIYYNDPSLEGMDELKLRHLQCFLQHGNNSYTLENYLDIIREWEEKARACYAEKIILSSSEFIEMVLIDASFIIFLWFSYHFAFENHPFKDKMVEVFSPVERDLFLEENQLPFFILNDLYDLAFGTSAYSRISFIDLTCFFIDNRFIRGKYDINVTNISQKIGEDGTIKHLVDFLRIYFILPSKLRQNRSNTNNISHDHHQFPLSVTELSAAGVKFVPIKSKSLLDIQFSNGVLHITSFIIQDPTEPLFRGIMLFEQCLHYFDSYFIDYIYFLFHLIKSPKDVRILVKNGIIDGWLASDEEVVNMFNGITNGIPINLPNYYYSAIAKELNAYASTPWHRWKVILKKDYFSHPWAIISFIYALLLLLLTLLQTISGFTSNK
ncbi:hypothetical protein RND81_10G044600 [Saponaria officinalis]|uniref:Uncharacterized protein n=1 Tax=Saponaria officinalis TaxID=3572 RepID=A0AAW1HY55_SAPOF